MKKIKLLLVMIIIVGGVCFITGCDKEQETKTVAVSLCETFETIAQKENDIEKIAQKIAESEIIVPEVQTFTIGKDDYLAGFKEEIKGFEKAVGIAPMIGTIPMIAYVFEVEEPQAFAESLKENAQLNWNICTQADEMQVAIVNEYVFFIMSPTSFEQ